MLQEHPKSQQSQRGEQYPPVKLFHLLEFLHALRRCFVPIDLLVDLLQRIRVGRSIELAVGVIGYGLQARLIDVHIRHDHVSVACLVPDGNRGLPAHADADGVYLDAQGSSCFRRSEWRDFPGVVDAVRQKYDYPGFWRRRAQMISGCGDGKADRRSIVAYTYVDTL